MKIYRYLEETWQAEYAAGPAPETVFEKHEETDVPLEVWDRLQRAQQELEDAREAIDSLFSTRA